MSVDTLTLARELRAADLGAVQADAIAAAIGRAVAETSATKADLSLTEAGIRSDLSLAETGIRSEVATLKADLGALRREVGQGNDALKAELGATIKASVKAMRSSMILWLIGVALALASLTVALLKL